MENLSASQSSNGTPLGGSFTLPGTSVTVHRMGYGAMQLAGPGVYGPPRDHARPPWPCCERQWKRA